MQRTTQTNTSHRQCVIAVLAVWLVLLSMPPLAYAVAPGLGVFESLTVLDGLSSNWVNTILQDDDGLMWFGTRSGINVYDGYSISTYSHIPGDSETLTDNNVFSMLKDSRGAMWAGTFRGLNRIDPHTRKITRFTGVVDDSTTLSNNNIIAIVEDSLGYLWFGTEMGLNRFDPETETFTRYYNGTSGVDERTRNHIRSLYIDDAGAIWIGGQEHLSLFDRDNGTYTEYPSTITVGDLPRGRSVISILPYDSERLLVTYEYGGIVLFHTTKRQFEPLPLIETAISRFSVAQIMSAYLDSNETFWIGTRRGLLRVNRDEGWVRVYSDNTAPYSLNNRMVTSVLEDRSGILWFATWGGIAKLNPAWEQFAYYTDTPVSPVPLSNSDVFAVTDDRTGNIWIGTVQGLNRIDHETGELTVYDHPHYPNLSSERITLLASDSDGNVWVATRYSDENKLIRIDRDGIIAATYDYDIEDASGIKADHISAFTEDRQGYLWFGTGGDGVTRYDRATNTFQYYDTTVTDGPVIAGNWISCILEDPAGNLWIGTDYGLLRMDQNRENRVRYMSNINDPASISSDRIRTFCIDSEERFWIGTENGLNLFDPETETFMSYLEDDGIASSTVYHLFEGPLGNLWMSTSRGISRFNPQTRQFRNYNYSDGLRDVEFTYGSGFWSEQNSTMFFGGWKGLIAFNPEDLRESTTIPPVMITSMKMLKDGESRGNILRSGGEIRLDYRENFFAFEFAVLDFAAPEENEFMYMLEGFDTEWVHSGTVRTANYTDVPPGEYTFHVRGANSRGVWNNMGTSISLVIVPPFWMTAWFRVLFGVTLVGLFALWYMNKNHAFNAQQMQLNEKVRERTRELEVKNQALIESEQRFKQMFEQSSTGFILADEAGKLIDVNVAGRKIFGTEGNEDRVYPNIFMDPFLPLQKIDELTRGNPVRFEVAYDFDDERVRTVFASKHTGIHSLDVVASPLGMTEQGNPSQYLFQITDTTEQKLLEEQLLIRERMDFLGNLSAGIAHDFNNLLVGIMGNLDLLRITTEEMTEEQTEYVDSALNACKRASGLIQDFQSLSTGPVAERGHVDLYQIARDVFSILERTTDRLIEKRIAFEPERYIVNARPDQLHQVFMNLGMNAAAAIQEKGIAPGDAITVDTEFVSHIPFEGRQYAEYVHIAFSDSGIGMTEEVKRRAFDPLFTTKARGVHKGQGLGLAMVYTIITRNHGGYIDIESTPGRGTVIHIYLPKGRLARRTMLQPAEHMPVGNETVLVVEDEPSVRKVTQSFLETQGYRVLTANDGREGLETYLSEWETIDLVLLDLTMPRLSGEVAYTRMLAANPDARIIICSGLGSEIQRQFSHAAAFLGKPYQMGDLARTVRDVLDREQSQKE